MLSPNYLTSADRKRLLEINEKLLTDLVGEDAVGLLPSEVEEIRRERYTELQKESQEIQARTKTIAECTFEELQDFRQQLFEEYQKHAAIGSRQTRMIAQFIKQVEYREIMIANKHVEEPKKVENDPPKPKSKSRVSTKQSSYSWTIDIE